MCTAWSSVTCSAARIHGVYKSQDFGFDGIVQPHMVKVPKLALYATLLVAVAGLVWIAWRLYPTQARPQLGILLIQL